MKKPSKVVFINSKLEKAFYKLNDEDLIKKFLIRAIRDLQKDAFSGLQIPKKLIPKEYVKKYHLNNS